MLPPLPLLKRSSVMEMDLKAVEGKEGDTLMCGFVLVTFLGMCMALLEVSAPQWGSYPET